MTGLRIARLRAVDAVCFEALFESGPGAEGEVIGNVKNQCFVEVASREKMLNYQDKLLARAKAYAERICICLRFLNRSCPESINNEKRTCLSFQMSHGKRPARSVSPA